MGSFVRHKKEKIKQVFQILGPGGVGESGKVGVRKDSVFMGKLANPMNEEIHAAYYCGCYVKGWRGVYRSVLS